MMSGWLAVGLVVAAMPLGAVWFLTSRRTKGKAGEWMVGFVLLVELALSVGHSVPVRGMTKTV